MPTIEEVEQALTLLSSKIDDTLASIHAGYLVLEQMKQQTDMLKGKLRELQQIKREIKNNT